MDMNQKAMKFEKLEKIGVGAYGTVYKIRENDTGRLFALKKTKIYHNEESLSVNVIRETSILRSIDHPNIIRLYRVEIDRKKSKALLFFELMEKNLKAIIDEKQITYGFLKSLIRQLLEGLKYLHLNQMIHRDIKPLNILLNTKEGILKIADFGLAKSLTLPISPMSVEVQTLWYKAPELLLGDENYTTQIDCWAAGCVIVEMILGKPLFSETSEIAQIFKIFEVLGSAGEGHYLSFLPYYKRSFPRFKKGKLRVLLTNFDDKLYTLVEGLLDLNLNSRLSTDQALKEFFGN